MTGPSPSELQRQALARLMARIGPKKDLPSLGSSIASIHRILLSEHAHMRTLTDSVLKDVALTAKLLRMINTATYRSSADDEILSIQRALSMMGFQAVGRMAASLIMFEKLPKGIEGARVREEFSQALLSGLLAQELCQSEQQAERSYLAGLFQNLGRMLVWMYFPDEAKRIAMETDAALAALGVQAAGPHAAAEHQRVARSVLGLTTEDLGIAVATEWGWPKEMLQTLRRYDPPANAAALKGDDYLRALATASSDLSARIHREDALPGISEGESTSRRTVLVEAFTRQLGGALSIEKLKAQPAIERGRENWQSLGEMLGLESSRKRPKPASTPSSTPVASFDRRETPFTPPVQGANAAPNSAIAQAATPPHLPTPQKTIDTSSLDVGAAPNANPGAVASPSIQDVAPTSDTSLDRLTRALERASIEVLSTAGIGQVATIVLDDMREALSLQRCVLCLRTPDGRLRGRFGSGLGDAAQARNLLAHFDVQLDRARDLFSLLCLNSRDTLISDSSQRTIADRLPDWYRLHVGAPTFLVLPMKSSTQVEGMLYFDRSPAGSLELDNRRLALLSALRTQLLVAIRLRQPAR